MCKQLRSRLVHTAPFSRECQICNPVFTYFPRLPIELRLMIWREAADDRVGHLVCIQPDKIQHTALLAACPESRWEICKRFEDFHVRNNNGECAWMFIETSKDTLYLNRRLKGLQISGFSQGTVWMAAQVMYGRLLRHITSLAMNLELMKKHTSAFRGGRHNIWLDLQLDCPRLRTLTLVASGSLKPDKHKLIFNPVASEALNAEDRQLLEYTLSSFDTARKEGCCRGLMLDLVVGKPAAESRPEALSGITYGMAYVDMYE